MCLWERIILKLYFPQFNSPVTSRFQTFFLTLNKFEKGKEKKKEISNIIFPDKIMQGEDKRTSIVIKNIPKNMKKKEIRKMVEKYGNINFLAISKDKEKENYVNFNYQGNLLNIQIVYSEVQGKSELKKVFVNDYFDKKNN